MGQIFMEQSLFARLLTGDTLQSADITPVEGLRSLSHAAGLISADPGDTWEPLCAVRRRNSLESKSQ